MKRLSSLAIAVIATLVLLAGILLFLASPLSAKKTAEVHLPEIQDRLPEHTGAAVPRELTQVDVNPETVQAVISTLNRPDSYSRTLQVFQFWAGGGRTSEIRVWVRSGDVRLNGCAGRVNARTVSGESNVTLQNTDAERIEAASTSGSVDIELPVGTPSVHAVMKSVSGSTRCRFPDAGEGAALQIQASSVSGSVRIG